LSVVDFAIVLKPPLATICDKWKSILCINLV
ncbi:hypothetical protein T01_7766, partial [Trichinella spiralis]